MVIASAIGLHVVWVLLPLIPAVLIYRLFPNTAVGVSGPLANLTVRASGAFAGYLIVFAASYPLVLRYAETIGGFQHPFWTIKGKVALIETDGTAIQLDDLLAKMLVETPQFFTHQSYYVRMNVPEETGDFPLVTIRIPEWGIATVDIGSLRSQSDMNMDPYRKTIELTKPIEIRHTQDPRAPLRLSPLQTDKIVGEK
jgi:hypothetical protein